MYGLRNTFCYMLTLVLSAALLPVHALGETGTRDGGGGGGVLCTEGLGQTSLEFFDLYEAKHELGLTLLPARSTINNELDGVQERLSAIWHGPPPEKVRSAYFHFTQKFQAVPKGTHLPVIDDANSSTVLPKNCRYVQIIHYIDGTPEDGSEDKVLVDTEYWDRLSVQEKAALFAHELFYSMYRRYIGARDSRIARRWVGYFFSTEGLQSPDDGIPTTGPLLYCTGSPNSYFNAFPSCQAGKCGTRIQFINLFHTGLPEKVIANADESLFGELKESHLTAPVRLSLESKSWNGIVIRFIPMAEDPEHHFFQIQIDDPSLKAPSVKMSCGIER